MTDHPAWIRDVMRWRELVEAIATPHGLDESLVLAMIAQESSGRPGAWNPEPRYRWLVDCTTGEPFREITEEEAASEIPPDDFPRPPGLDRDAEWWGQQASWGLLQTMGAVARERGFRRPDLPDLTQPVLGITYGVRQLVWLRKRVDSEADVLACYNGGLGAEGGNRGYVDAVRDKMAVIEGNP